MQTEIYGISDATGALTGNWIDATGVRRGFSGDEIIEVPDAVATYSDFVNSAGAVIGSYIGDDGIHRPYLRSRDNRFVSFDLPTPETPEFFLVHGITDTFVSVSRAQVLGDVTRTYVGSFAEGFQELKFPDSVRTEGWNINQDVSVVGHYDTADGRRHGFIARLTSGEVPVVDPVVTPDYTFETIEVEGVDFLALTASSDFEGYAGYTKSPDGEKDVGFTLIDGVFTTYDYPGALNTYFYALGNDGTAAGYYQASDGLHHGVILENGELRRYDFPNAVQTEIYGISDVTGVLTGSFIDVAGVRRGFSGDRIIEVPGALATFADFSTGTGAVAGVYLDSDGVYQGYVHAPDGRLIFADVLEISAGDWFFVHGITDFGVIVVRSQAVGDIVRTYVGRFGELGELQYPESLSTEGWNINRDGSVVGHYESADGGTHGFIARPVSTIPTEPVVVPTDFTFETIEVPGVDFLELTASSDFNDYAGNALSPDGQKRLGFTLIDGVFETYDYPGSQHTYFYALGNDGRAAGYYEDSDGLHHGLILENGELRRYDFPNAVETEIYGISDATGVLTGNWTDAEGVRRGFSGETIVEVPGAAATYADFVSGSGTIVGSFINSDGVYKGYGRAPDGRFIFVDVVEGSAVDWLFIHGINDVGVFVVRAQVAGDVPRTYVGRYGQLRELQFPESLSTAGYNINQDGSVVGHYQSADGRTHGFIARPTRPNRT